MQNKFVVGGKYIAKSKSVGDPFDESNVLRRAREKGQPFLYFKGIDKTHDGEKVLGRNTLQLTKQLMDMKDLSDLKTGRMLRN